MCAVGEKYFDMFSIVSMNNIEARHSLIEFNNTFLEDFAHKKYPHNSAGHGASLGIETESRETDKGLDRLWVNNSWSFGDASAISPLELSVCLIVEAFLQASNAVLGKLKTPSQGEIDNRT